MSEQTSNKEGLHSAAEKAGSSRHGTNPQPSASPVAGAHGERERPTPGDVDISLLHNTRRQERERAENSSEDA
jgi:hypothetical protein